MKIFFLFFLLLFTTNVFSQNSIANRLEVSRYKALAKYKGVGYYDTLSSLACFYNDSAAGYINSFGKEICRLKNAISYDFSNGVGVIKQGNLFYMLNSKGNIIKKFNHISTLHKFQDGQAIVGKSINGYERFGIMDKDGKFKIHCNYSAIEKISSKYYLVTNNGVGQGIINTNEDTILPLKYVILYVDTSLLNFIGYSSNGFGIFNLKGQLLSKMNKNFYYENIYIEGNHYFQREGLIIAKDKFSGDSVKFCVLNLKLDTIIPLGKYSKIDEINEGLIKVANSVATNEKSSKLVYGFVNKEDKFVIEPRYDFAMYFTEGLASVNINNKWGYIDKNDNLVIPLEFDYALPFRNGYAEVILNKKRFLINNKGEKIIEITNGN